MSYDSWGSQDGYMSGGASSPWECLPQQNLALKFLAEKISSIANGVGEFYVSTWTQLHEYYDGNLDATAADIISNLDYICHIFQSISTSVCEANLRIDPNHFLESSSIMPVQNPESGEVYNINLNVCLMALYEELASSEPQTWGSQLAQWLEKLSVTFGMHDSLVYDRLSEMVSTVQYEYVQEFIGVGEMEGGAGAWGVIAPYPSLENLDQVVNELGDVK